MGERHLETFRIEVRAFPEQRYAGWRRRVTIKELGPFIHEATATLRAVHGRHGPAFAIFYGEVDDAHDGPVEVGVLAETGERLLEAGEAAVTRVRGAERQFPEILDAFAALSGWAKSQGRPLSGPPREVYLSANEWEIVWPLAPERIDGQAVDSARL